MILDTNPVPRRHTFREKDSWIAPEHSRFARSMRKDYPRDERGDPLREHGRRLVLDPRPAILVPARKTYIGFKHEPNDSQK